MKRTEFNELKQLDPKALKSKILEVKKEIADLSLDKGMGALKDLKSIGKKKRDVAQMSTVLNQKLMLEKLEGVNK